MSDDSAQFLDGMDNPVLYKIIAHPVGEIVRNLVVVIGIVVAYTGSVSVVRVFAEDLVHPLVKLGTSVKQDFVESVGKGQLAGAVTGDETPVSHSEPLNVTGIDKDGKIVLVLLDEELLEMRVYVDKCIAIQLAVVEYVPALEIPAIPEIGAIVWK